jgi:hypothetical protein
MYPTFIQGTRKFTNNGKYMVYIYVTKELIAFESEMNLDNKYGVKPVLALPGKTVEY